VVVSEALDDQPIDRYHRRAISRHGEKLMKIYGHPASTCTRKVLCTLNEKGAPYEFIIVDITKGEQKSPEHLARQPFGVVPALDDDGFMLYESRAMIRYLDGKLSGVSLTPSDLRARAMMDQWISVETSNFTPYAMKVIYQSLFAKWRGFEPDLTALKEGRAGTVKALEVLEPALEGRTHLVGDTFTLADLNYAPYLQYLDQGGHGDLVAGFPNVAAWWDRVRARPAWQKVIG
jgi:glutathione S-transferase